MSILIDGDVVLFRCGFGAEKTKYKLNGDRVFDSKAEFDEYAEEEGLEDYELEIYKDIEPLENALHNVSTVLDRIRSRVKKSLGLSKMEIYLSGDNNFRDEIATLRPYKGNRKKSQRPYWEKEIRQYLIKYKDAKVVDGHEADDELGIRQIELVREGGWKASCIVTVDKDLDMIPGYHYNWVKDEFYSTTPPDGLRLFYQQALSGDSTDNIPGIPGVGPAKAEKMLSEASTGPEMWDIVLREYQKVFPDEDYEAIALENARLVWIRRKRDELWTPPEKGE